MALSRAFLENARQGDALVNVSGLLGLLPVPGMSVYAGTKEFVLSFSQALWHEQKERGFRLSAERRGAHSAPRFGSMNRYMW